MVKKRKQNNRKTRNSKQFNGNKAKPRKINASTHFETCTEHLSPFGGLLGLVKFLKLFDFEEIFESTYQAPKRKPKLGHYSMMFGILMLLFIGFNRIWHFVYIGLDTMICGALKVSRLPVASTFWRYLDSLGINQAESILKIGALLREQVWQQSEIDYRQISVDIDTTVETVYGNQQGVRKGHNTSHRGKKGYRPVLAFIEQTREYLIGKLRKGETMSGEETAKFIRSIRSQLPSCVKNVLLRADGEFISWDSVKAAKEEGFDIIFANKKCDPPFDPNRWYKPNLKKEIEYNNCVYKPIGWGEEHRFVAMRIPKREKSGKAYQCPLFENDQYTYRIFCTTLKGKARDIIATYDKRADVENLVGESKREGLDAIPSAKFKNNYAFFQIVMLAYNIWRYFKMLAAKTGSKKRTGFPGIVDNTLKIARLKLLMIAAKIVENSNRVKVKYSIHDARTPWLIEFYEYLDQLIIEKTNCVFSKC